MCKIIGKSNERILCKLNKSEILRLYSIIHVAMETTKTSNFTCQSKSFISIFPPAKFQLVSCNLSLAMIWQMTYTHKLPKLCSATLILPVYVAKHCRSRIYVNNEKAGSDSSLFRYSFWKVKIVHFICWIGFF